MPRLAGPTLLAMCALVIGQPGRGEESVAASASGTVTVHTTGYDGDEGDALISLVNSRSVFESDKEAFRSTTIPVKDGAATAVFENVPHGEYAVKVFHDANRNRKLDFGMMGPKEAYGFSNNARGTFGPPDYDETKFTFATEQLTVEIEAK